MIILNGLVRFKEAHPVLIETGDKQRLKPKVLIWVQIKNAISIHNTPNLRRTIVN